MTPKEEYVAYLKTSHWDALRTVVLERDGNQCTCCPNKKRLQVHHKFYRIRWEDSQPGDCVTLCNRCHEKEHGIGLKPAPPIVVKPVPLIANIDQLHEARSKKLITRAAFEALREQFGGKQASKALERPRKPKAPKGPNGWKKKLKAQKTQRRKQKSKGKPVSRPDRRLRLTPIHNWVNRDNSSN